MAEEPFCLSEKNSSTSRISVRCKLRISTAILSSVLAVMARADIVSLHVSLNEETRGLIDQTRLKLMKRESYLVNTSRPAVVDKEALVKALEEKEIAGAAIDVHEPEPVSPDDPLVRLDNVIATPWTAYNTKEGNARMCIMAARDVVTVLQGGVPKFPVNKLEGS